jgi:hypothetical protein
MKTLDWLVLVFVIHKYLVGDWCFAVIRGEHEVSGFEFVGEQGELGNGPGIAIAGRSGNKSGKR